MLQLVNCLQDDYLSTLFLISWLSFKKKKLFIFISATKHGVIQIGEQNRLFFKFSNSKVWIIKFQNKHGFAKKIKIVFSSFEIIKSRAQFFFFFNSSA